MGADDGQPLEVDEDVFEELGVLAGRAHARAGNADVDRHRQAELGAGGVHRVVELVVERVLVDERRHPHQHDGRVGGQGPQPRDLRDGPVGPVDGQRDAEAVGMGCDGIEQRVRLLRREAGGDHAHVDAAGIHGGEQLRQGRGGRQVAAEQLGDALVAGLAQEGRGGLAGERVDPEIDDRHAGVGGAGGRRRSGRRRSGRVPTRRLDRGLAFGLGAGLGVSASWPWPSPWQPAGNGRPW